MNEKYLSRIDQVTKRKYLSLDEPIRREVDKLFARHERASAKCELGPDPFFLAEMMQEINADRIDFAVEGFGVEIS